MTVGHALWPDQLTAQERALLAPGVPANVPRDPDVLVVGGGMLGCATAAACLQAGLGTVVVLERDSLGAGASGGAAGLLMPESHAGVDPPEYVALMRDSFDAWRALDTTWPGGVGLLPFDYHGHTQARVNPLRALARLAAGLPHVATGLSVHAVDTNADRVRTVHTSAGAFQPRNVVFATGTPPQVDGLRLDLAWSEVKGHMLATAPTALQPPPQLVDVARAIDDGRILMGGTLDVGDDARVVRSEIIASMWQELEAAWPAAREIDIEYRWACFRPAHPDHLPVIDRVPGVRNAWLTSGHYKTGILSAPGTARALAQWLQTGAAPEVVRPFAVARYG